MTVSKIQTAQPTIVRRNPHNRSDISVADTNQVLQPRSSTRRCLFGKAKPGENLKIAKEQSQAIFERIRTEYITRIGFDIGTDQPVQENSETPGTTERLQEDAGRTQECPGEVRDTVTKQEDTCNGGSARNPPNAEKSHRVKPYDRATKQTHITDFMREVKKPRASIESKEKH
ncbi:uncharacterized protein LOC132258371 [Phlebotomus argentipes]|uniref:uncharacterized protein LOC132258371 n=1 Tax=Phlebotomus argentipes TaxID=94469 RepID=UPI0028932C61|nr:uncharacterized protein LOC132258371 [Phlebotomus argentipes]